MNRQAARRIKGATSRLENQPYDFVPRRRTPRLSTGSAILWCSPSGGISSGGHISGQTLYVRTGGTTKDVNTDATIYNNYGSATVATKVMCVSLNPDGTYSVVAQSCT